MRSALRFLAANYYIMFCGASSSNYCTKRQRFYPLPLFFALKRAESPFSFCRQQTADLPPIQRCAAGGGFTLDVSVHIGRLRRPGKSRCSPAGTKGDRTPNMVSCPLLTPLTFLWTRLPPVARLNARGPQGRLVLQGFILDRSGAFRSANQAPCTVWPRTVMRGKPRKVNSGPYSVP